MADDQPEVPKPEVPKAKDAQEELVESFDRFIASAKAAGVRPVKVMLAAYAKQGADILDSFLGALEEGRGKQKRKKKPQ